MDKKEKTIEILEDVRETGAIGALRMFLSLHCRDANREAEYRCTECKMRQYNKETDRNNCPVEDYIRAYTETR